MPVFKELSLKEEMKRIKKYLEETNQLEDWKWVKELIKEIGIKDFNSTFCTYTTQDNLNPSFVDLDKALLVYEEILDDFEPHCFYPDIPERYIDAGFDKDTDYYIIRCMEKDD